MAFSRSQMSNLFRYTLILNAHFLLVLMFSLILINMKTSTKGEVVHVKLV